MTITTWILFFAFLGGLAMIWWLIFIRHDFDKAILTAFATILIGVACVTLILKNRVCLT